MDAAPATATSATATSASALGASALVAYDYALVRAVPHADRDDGETVAALVHARRARLIAVAVAPDAAGVAARWPGLDAGLLAAHLRALADVLVRGAGPIGCLPASERFHWATAPRSTVLRPGPVRTGLDADPLAAFERLCRPLALQIDR